MSRALSVLPRDRRLRLQAIVAGGAIVAALLMLSLLSMQAAAARARIAALDRQVADTRRATVALATEFGIRSRPGVLLGWGDTTLALAPPRVGQYLGDLHQLQVLARPTPDPRAYAAR